MKNVLFVGILLAFLIGANSCKKEEIIQPEASTSNFTLTDQEKLDLQFLREEEKLAYDVYTYAFNKYSLDLFSNIASSELTHTNSVLALLNSYGVKDPVGSNELGVFTNQTLQQLYTDLTAKVDISLTDALIVGATIEDLDINDISNLTKNAKNFNVIAVYQNLACGSRNHLRSFTKQLNGNYTPQYISASEYLAIVSGANEKCGK